MHNMVERVVIVGAGTAGWFAASLIAGSRRARAAPLSIRLVAAPDVSFAAETFAAPLSVRATRNPGIMHILNHVAGVRHVDNGDIAALAEMRQRARTLAADLAAADLAAAAE